MAERSITKKYRKTIWNRFIGAIKEYSLLEPGDTVGVCISGGKDSMLLAVCFKLLQKYSDFDFDVKYLAMDPGYNEENALRLRQNAELLDIPVHYFDAPIFNYVYKQEKGSPCYLCARMRRGYLYKEAKSLGCNKIALGHHFDDVIETVMMSMLYQGSFQTMMPKLPSTNYEGMELIRPLYHVHESDIISWSEYNSLKFLRCACRFTENAEEHEEDSKRKYVKSLIKQIKKDNPSADANIFHSMYDVNLSTIISYRESDRSPCQTFNELYSSRQDNQCKVMQTDTSDSK